MLRAELSIKLINKRKYIFNSDNGNTNSGGNNPLGKENHVKR